MRPVTVTDVDEEAPLMTEEQRTRPAIADRVLSASFVTFAESSGTWIPGTSARLKEPAVLTSPKPTGLRYCINGLALTFKPVAA